MTSHVSVPRDTTPEDIAKLLKDWLNSYDRAELRGAKAGKQFLEEHRSLQGLVVNFMVAALVAMADGDTDPRNAKAIELCRKVKQIVDKSGYQPLI